MANATIQICVCVGLCRFLGAVYFDLDMDKGVLAIGQATYKHHQNRADNGLPGMLTLGGYYQSSRFDYLADSTQSKLGNYGFYCVFDQMIFRGDWPEFLGPSHMRSRATYGEKVKQPYYWQTTVAKDRPKGLSLWVGTYFAPQEEINTQSYQLTGGLVYQGLPPNRDRDVTSFCVIMGKFSDQLPGKGTETVLEVNHRFQLGPWFYITPDMQYVIKPNGQSNIPNAWVIGIEASINF